MYFSALALSLILSPCGKHHHQSIRLPLRENGMELFAAFAGLAPARGGQAVALVWNGLRADAGCSMRFRARRGGGLSAAAVDVVSAACGRGSGRVDVVV